MTPYTNRNKGTRNISTYTQLEIVYTDSQDGLVLSFTVVSLYYNCCTDGSTSPVNYDFYAVKYYCIVDISMLYCRSDQLDGVYKYRLHNLRLSDLVHRVAQTSLPFTYFYFKVPRDCGSQDEVELHKEKAVPYFCEKATQELTSHEIIQSPPPCQRYPRTKDTRCLQDPL
jgi:hypothetical protein